MVCFSTGTQQQKQVYNCNTNNVGVVHDEWANYLHVYRCLLTNHLHDKAAERYLAIS